MQQQLKEQLENLFEKWRQNSSNANYKDYFYKDGCFDCEKYLKQSVKILYFLKETNGSSFYSITEFYEKYFNSDFTLAPRNLTLWQKLREWTEGVQSCRQNGEEFEYKPYEEIAAEDIANINGEDDRLKRVAVVNVKKYYGASTSIDKKLNEYAANDKTYIFEEIKLLNPDVIVCGHTLSKLKKVIAKESGVTFKKVQTIRPDKKADSEGGILTINEKEILVIDMYHPSYTKLSEEDYYNMLMDKYTKVKRAQNKNL